MDIYMEKLKQEYQQVNENLGKSKTGKYSTEYNNIRNEIRRKENSLKKIDPKKDREIYKKETLAITKLKIEFRKVRPQIPESILIRIQYG
jgi:hypothetical protein